MSETVRKIENLSVGRESAPMLTSGEYNICIGYRAGENLTTGSYNILLGDRAGREITTQSDRLALGRFITIWCPLNRIIARQIMQSLRRDESEP